MTPIEKRWMTWGVVMAFLIGACLGLATAEWVLIPVPH